MSELGWVDFSSTQREQVSKILAMLKEPGTLDELGIGQIRDAFADLLFPGFSTIQTRAKYLITVPRIFRDYHLLSASEKKRIKLQKYLADSEDEVAKRLVEKHGSSEEGIIGSTMIDKGGVAKRPSSVYWNAFRQFGIIKDSTSLREFCLEYEKDNDGNHYATEHEDGADDEGHYRLKDKVEIPSLEEDWLENVEINLTKKEADFLYLYMMQSSNIANSIPAQVFKHNLLDQVLEEKYKSLEILTFLFKNTNAISSTCRNTVILANEFSLAMEGPHIRYNIIIAKRNKHNTVDKYEKEYDKWFEEVERKNLFYKECSEVWLSAAAKNHPKSFKSKTISFIKEWNSLIQKNASKIELDELVETRAKQNKGNRSLLYKKITKEDWIGIRRLDYRWSSAIKILQDISDGRKHDSSK